MSRLIIIMRVLFLLLSLATSLASAKVLESLTLQEMSKELRGKDNRLVRSFPEKTTTKVRIKTK